MLFFTENRLLYNMDNVSVSDLLKQQDFTAAPLFTEQLSDPLSSGKGGVTMSRNYVAGNDLLTASSLIDELVCK